MAFHVKRHPQVSAAAPEIADGQPVRGRVLISGKAPVEKAPLVAEPTAQPVAEPAAQTVAAEKAQTSAKAAAPVASADEGWAPPLINVAMPPAVPSRKVRAVERMEAKKKAKPALKPEPMKKPEPDAADPLAYEEIAEIDEDDDDDDDIIVSAEDRRMILATRVFLVPCKTWLVQCMYAI